MRRSTVLLLLLACAWIAAGEAAAAAPANDHFADAVLLGGGSGAANGTTVDATAEAGEPAHARSGGGRSVWFRWTAPAAGSVTFDTCTNSFDTVLAVYRGTAVNSLEEVGANDDACQLGSRVSFTALAGTEYRIAVDGYGSASGTFTLAWGPTPAIPVNVRLPVVSGSRRVGATLTATPGAWSGAEPLTFTYVWLRCWNGCSVVPGATGATYTVAAADLGFSLAVVVTARNSGGSATATGEAGLIEALAPQIAEEPVVDVVPRAGTTAEAVVGSFSGTTPITYGYQWQRCSPDSRGRDLANVALGRPVRASGVFPANPAQAAVDGNLDSYWSAGTFAPQSIEIDLGVPTPVAAVRLDASQSPTGLTVHRVSGRYHPDEAEFLLHEFAGTTSDLERLDASLGDPIVRFVRVETVLSPSWVAWREIQVLSRCRDIPGATHVGFEPRPADIGFSLRFLMRATNPGGTTAAVSSETDAVEGCIVPRLVGKTVRAARAALTAAGCRIGRVDRARSRVRAGRIVGQSAAAGARRVWRAPIRIVVSRGPRP